MCQGVGEHFAVLCSGNQDPDRKDNSVKLAEAKVVSCFLRERQENEDWDKLCM